MRILVTNDDGINARGLVVLEKIARELSDDVWVIAPAEEQSGAGHSLTLTRPLRLRKHGERRYSVLGTPTDCVLMAVRHVMKDCRPDLILSGVNRGMNVAEDLTYSGTVSAAMEGAISGIRSIALSQAHVREDMGDEGPYSASEGWGARVLRPLIALPVDKHMLLNVNFPPIPADAVKGVRVVKQGFHDPGRFDLVKARDPRGYDYFWFGIGGGNKVPNPGTDLDAIDQGYISVTPLHYDLTRYDAMASVEEAIAGQF